MSEIEKKYEQLKKYADTLEGHLWKALPRLPANMNTSDMKVSLSEYRKFKDELISKREDLVSPEGDRQG